MYIEDVKRSMEKTLYVDKWIFGLQGNRLGHPFEWIDGGNIDYLYKLNGVVPVLRYLAMFSPLFDVPKKFRVEDYDEMLNFYEDILTSLIEKLVPFMKNDNWYMEYIKGTASVRTQDYSFIKTFCDQLPAKGATHIDFGPGLGTHAVYSLKKFSTKYIGIEASPFSYGIQRYFFRHLSYTFGQYLDIVEAENFDFDIKSILTSIEKEKYSLIHVPSWKATCLKDGIADLVTASWVLNEVTYMGIVWLVYLACRTLKKGGYFYIRDSNHRKPGRHNIDYDQVLIDNGFKIVYKFNADNQKNYHGIPRCYQKETDSYIPLQELIDSTIGKYNIVIHGGNLVQLREQ